MHRKTDTDIPSIPYNENEAYRLNLKESGIPQEMEGNEKTPQAALTELFTGIKTDHTPTVIERIVAYIDAIVRIVRFPGWQSTSSGEREVQKSLRSALLKYKLLNDQNLYDQAYAYIREYY